MRFKIVSVGWQCADWIEQTLRSVEEQSLDTWDIGIVYDASDDAGAEIIGAWCRERRLQRDHRWHDQINPERRFAVRNQYEAIQALQPADEDVVVFLDLDGDRLAHPDVLARLAEHYADGTLVTYGSYEPVPKVGPPGYIAEFPPEVVRDRSYRQHTLSRGCCFNHLRTMKGRVANAIPVTSLQWASGPLAGRWYEIGTDYVFMMAALELANGKYKVIRETLLLYNHANPLADNIAHAGAGVSGVHDSLNRPPLPPLPEDG